ncbi:MAG TPA: type II toxin-antitoxin system VapB family antitoxin [Methylomirabilota bacterium]|nr:type II toxin-antitoxin system VapB family antitoxin [Methylomirabilota bacterium]
MALTITNPDADRLARELAAVTGEELAEAVLNALRERLTREQERRQTPRLRDQLRVIRQRCAQLPVLDTRSPDDIVGYDNHGVPR